jgi:hypothetical protein
MSRACLNCRHWSFQRQGNAEKAGRCAVHDKVTLESDVCDKHEAAKPNRSRGAKAKA